jgi:hypothetical protein
MAKWNKDNIITFRAVKDYTLSCLIRAVDLQLPKEELEARQKVARQKAAREAAERAARAAREAAREAARAARRAREAAALEAEEAAALEAEEAAAAEFEEQLDAWFNYDTKEVAEAKMQEWKSNPKCDLLVQFPLDVNKIEKKLKELEKTNCHWTEFFKPPPPFEHY